MTLQPLEYWLKLKLQSAVDRSCKQHFVSVGTRVTDPEERRAQEANAKGGANTHWSKIDISKIF